MKIHRDMPKVVDLGVTDDVTGQFKVKMFDDLGLFFLRLFYESLPKFDDCDACKRVGFERLKSSC